MLSFFSLNSNRMTSFFGLFIATIWTKLILRAYLQFGIKCFSHIYSESFTQNLAKFDATQNIRCKVVLLNRNFNWYHMKRVDTWSIWCMSVHKYTGTHFNILMLFFNREYAKRLVHAPWSLASSRPRLTALCHGWLESNTCKCKILRNLNRFR